MMVSSLWSVVCSPDFRLESPWFLLLLVPLVLFFILALIRKNPSVYIPWIKPFEEINSKKKINKTIIPTILYFVATVILIFALARPQKGMEELKQHTEGIDIILALDLSGSMRSIDIPSNFTNQEIQDALKSGLLKERIQFAKQEIIKFIERRPNDRIGLIVFAPLPYVASPPTLDSQWLLDNLKTIDAGIIGDATNIAGPIASAVDRLKDSKAKRRVIVLFTDGGNNVNARISPIQAAKLAKLYNIIIYTVGIGSNNAYFMQNTSFGSQLFPLGDDQFDEQLLKDIAKETGGKYYSASDAKGLEQVMTEINKIEKTSFEQPKIIDYSELAPNLISIAIAFILIAFILERTWLIKIP